MELELRAQTVLTRTGETRTANGSQGHQRSESGECAKWDCCQSLAKDVTGRFQKIHPKEHIEFETNNLLMVFPLVAKEPKQLGRLLIVAMSCPLLLEAQQDP